MDLGGARLVARIGRGAAGAGVPRIGADPAGDLRTKLEAFERGVDDILTLPSTPGELLARVVAPVRRAYRGVAAVRPVIRLRDPQIAVTRWGPGDRRPAPGRAARGEVAAPHRDRIPVPDRHPSAAVP
jgi:DNA-binding response OmpR family regulator